MFNKETIIYIPCRNCEHNVLDTIQSIPKELHEDIECLVIDNFSTDDTFRVVKRAKDYGSLPFAIHLIKTKRDLGYAGSQKLAYHIIIKHSIVKNIIMLHGDGQYDSNILLKFISYIHSNEKYAVVNGYRDKNTYPHDETPYSTYWIIKTLNGIENLVTNFNQKEWHSGLVMYHTDFLRKLPLPLMTDTQHIDGELLIFAGILGEKTAAFPIYKRYKKHEAFSGIPRIKYIFDVFAIMFKFINGHYHNVLKSNSPQNINNEYEII